MSSVWDSEEYSFRIQTTFGPMEVFVEQEEIRTHGGPEICHSRPKAGKLSVGSPEGPIPWIGRVQIQGFRPNIKKFLIAPRYDSTTRTPTRKLETLRVLFLSRSETEEQGLIASLEDPKEFERYKRNKGIWRAMFCRKDRQRTPNGLGSDLHIGTEIL